MKVLALLVLLTVLSSTVGLPTVQQDSELIITEESTTASYYENNNSFAGDLSQIIALNLLNWNLDIDGNQAHSPLGVTTLLTILAEGSSDEGYINFVNVLGYPKDRLQLRETFGRILNAYSSNSPRLQPYFKTWLYIYRNQTARDDFKDLLRTTYHVEVKDIDRNLQEPTSEEIDSLDSLLEATTTTNSKDIIGFDSIKRLKSTNNDGDDDDDGDGDESTNVKDGYGIEIVDKIASKFDRNVDDHQYVEVPIIRKEDQQKKQNSTADLASDDTQNSKTTKVIEARSRKDENDVNLLENETVRDEEKIDLLRKSYNIKRERHDSLQKLFESNEPQRVSLPLRKFEDIFDGVDIWEAVRSHLRLVRARTLYHKDDVASALNANSITGRSSGAKTKMLLFNGMYYSGTWAYPFTELKSNLDEDKKFHLTTDDEIKVPMMVGRGKYSIADLENLNAKAISIPYQNQRFSMILLVPDNIEGLRSLLQNIQPKDLKLMLNRLEEKEIVLYLPKFKVEETSRSDGMLKKMKLQTLFSNEKSDLSLLTSDPDVRVDELVQFVNVQVNEGGSSENSLTASNIEGRVKATTTATNDEIVRINRPFAYFIFDNIEEFVIVSGKIMVPDFKEDEPPVTIEIELEQS